MPFFADYLPFDTHRNHRSTNRTDRIKTKITSRRDHRTTVVPALTFVRLKARIGNVSGGKGADVLVVARYV